MTVNYTSNGQLLADRLFPVRDDFNLATHVISNFIYV